MSYSIDLGIIGGTGVYQMNEVSIIEEIDIETPFGSPSSPITIGEMGGKSIAFLARHGKGHVIPPSDINYRANIYALKSLGIKSIIAISACGSLREDYAPGDIVIPDQIIDFTKNRERTFFGKGLVAHVSTADPFCPHLSEMLFNSVKKTGVTVHLGSSLVTIEGPRFSTKAESNLFRSWGMSIIGMTSSPEVFLAREAEICYAALAHVTDYDVWHSSEAPVSVDMILEVLEKNSQIANQAILNIINEYDVYECECQTALKFALTSSQEFIEAQEKEKLKIIVNKYLK